jgi:hypothetical protein
MSRKQAITVRDGEGERLEVLGARVRFLCQGEKTGRAWSLMEAVLPMDSGPPPHEHPWDEAYYVVDGASADRPARILVFDAPAHAEGFFRDVHREVKEMPRDMAKVPAIGARHQLRFLPPRA